MSSPEARPEIYGNGITHASPALWRMLELVQASDFISLLTADGLTNLLERFEEIAGSVDINAEPQKVFVQLCFRDPSKERLTNDDTSWAGCEYTIWTDDEYIEEDDPKCRLTCKFESYRIPAVEHDLEPLRDPALANHHHIVISDNEIDWTTLAPSS